MVNAIMKGCLVVEDGDFGGLYNQGVSG